MKEIRLTPKASEDLEAIWLYSLHNFGQTKADEYIGRLSDIFDVLARHDIGVARTDLGEDIYSLPIESHVIFFIPTTSELTIIRILGQSQDAVRHLSWR